MTLVTVLSPTIKDCWSEAELHKLVDARTGFYIDYQCPCLLNCLTPSAYFQKSVYTGGGERRMHLDILYQFSCI